MAMGKKYDFNVKQDGTAHTVVTTTQSRVIQTAPLPGSFTLELFTSPVK